MNIYRSKQLGTEGNLKGDGTLLGAVYVLGKFNTGTLGTEGNLMGHGTLLGAVYMYLVNEM